MSTARIEPSPEVLAALEVIRTADTVAPPEHLDDMPAVEPIPAGEATETDFAAFEAAQQG